MICVLFFFRRLFYTRARLLLACVGVRALVCRRRRRRQRACARRVPESKDFEEEKSEHQPFFFCFFPSLCKGFRELKTSLFAHNLEERDDGDENGVEQRQTGQSSSLDFEQQQQQ